MRAALLAALHAAPPDLIVVTGDITQRARVAQFKLAAAFFEALPDVPRVCLPGNHDLPLFDVFTRLLTFPNVLITGHQGFFTREALGNISATTVANLTEFEQTGASANAVRARGNAP